jgi:hypothetical protein
VSSGQSIRSDAARRSIARFTGGAWTVGAIVMALIAFGTFSRLQFDPQTGALLDTGDDGGYSDIPWEDENLPQIEPVDGNVYAGEGNAVIRIDDVTTEPLQIVQLSDVYIDLSMTESGDIDPDTLLGDSEWPLDVGRPQPDLPAVVFPYEGTLELWVETEDPWQLRIEPLDAEEITDVVSGQGNQVLVYRGPSASALFEFAGEGIFFVTAYTREEGQESIIIESDPLRERQSWTPSETVVLLIESDAERGAWVVDIDDVGNPSTPSPSTSSPSTSSPSTPSPEATDAPTEQETP